MYRCVNVKWNELKVMLHNMSRFRRIRLVPLQKTYLRILLIRHVIWSLGSIQSRPFLVSLARPRIPFLFNLHIVRNTNLLLSLSHHCRVPMLIIMSLLALILVNYLWFSINSFAAFLLLLYTTYNLFLRLTLARLLSHRTTLFSDTLSFSRYEPGGGPLSPTGLPFCSSFSPAQWLLVNFLIGPNIIKTYLF